jgi:hypothetical protein
MNDSTVKEIANQQMPLYTALRGFINATNYINIGFITKVHSENYVDVSLYYTSSSGKKVVIQAVRLLHIGTTKCKLLITPAVGDNVLLLCPKDFIEKLQYNRIPQNSKDSYLPYGDINMCGILIKAEEDTNVKTTIKIDEKGDISVETDGGINLQCGGDAVVNTDGNAEVVAEGDVSVEAKQNATLKSQNTKLTGGIVEVGGTVTPTGQGAFCGIPYCPYTGAPQTGKQSSGA